MTVPAAKVASLCTAPESALVRASRRPELNQLTVSQLKKLVVRARKLFDKWQEQGRTQARAKSQQLGAGTIAERTELKTQIFADAVKSFEVRLAQLEADASAAAAKPKPKAKKKAGTHRAERANVRKSLADLK
jgi:hypothetical protein